ncbi:ATP-dependent DNA helicase DinG [Fangia hongkongensis]|uniref:ATP-dependent DNA helicase DinG n=1 Tax=Fangia hongkongensis TaxID=270495 RepID=UPI000365F883|nr:ATP-dependent DNA helicase DinG [Fangia hongkongensis]MBK2126264.1 ATP-dependent DNA helicase DinG [Fangia hongkongensis]
MMNEKELKALFQSAGLSVRESQLNMVNAVKSALINAENLVIEAPTATGKSFAYLLGAILYNQYRESKGKEKLNIIVSTATVALQEQLIHKDLPFIQSLIGEDKKDAPSLSYTLAKGRSRYLCPRKLHSFDSSDSALTEEAEKLDRLYQKDWSGDFDDLEVPISKALNQEIYNSSNACSFSRCEYYKTCPFLTERAGLRNQDIIVVNHSLLLAHLNLGDGAILPAFEKSIYIIDECHHLPDKALDAFSAYSSLIGSQKWVNDVDKLLNALPQKLVEKNMRENWQLIKKSLIESLTAFQQMLHPLYQSATKEDAIWRIKSMSDEMLEVAGSIKKAADYYVKECESLKRKLEDFAETSDIHKKDSLEKTFTQLGFLLERSQNLQSLYTLLLNTNSVPPVAKWLQPHASLEGKETDKGQQKRPDDLLAHHQFEDYDLHASPVEAASLLKKMFWGEVQHGVILCSATVRSLGKFDRFLNATGLKNNAKTLLLPSPLPYHNSTLSIPDMRFMPQAQEDHIKETAALLNEQYLKGHPDGALVLFTSIYAMERVYSLLSAEIKRCVLVQGDRSKQMMIALHKKKIDSFKPSVIFGVDSFSEGVDLAGAYLTRLIIHKLPFQVPTNPIDKTRSEWLESIGRKPFMDISLPQASLKLTQMVGRLVRQETDVGEIIILDSRLKQKFYGKALLAGLPPFAIKK